MNRRKLLSLLGATPIIGSMLIGTAEANENDNIERVFWDWWHVEFEQPILGNDQTTWSYYSGAEHRDTGIQHNHELTEEEFWEAFTEFWGKDVIPGKYTLKKDRHYFTRMKPEFEKQFKNHKTITEISRG